MADHRAEAMVLKLWEQSRARALRWSATGEVDTFAVVLASYAVQVKRNEYPDGAGSTLALCDLAGDVIEEIDGDDISGLKVLDPASGKYLNGWSVLYQIWEIARRSALGVDRAMDAILAALSETEQLSLFADEDACDDEEEEEAWVDGDDEAE